ncbi:hypothetical protein BDW42DRAFT_83663 [Aspergillus taichungensis]|uniref:Uncharacterized protein n=1 Tax=Aspergillus taichungensis TaxID=482145 RepID=A0A2J5HXK5_9EURO|nr:hypothetical protein BDW42DRAFT_83663 [Aspergillus taichungensis]
MPATTCNLEYACFPPPPYRQPTIAVSPSVLFTHLFSPCVFQVGYLSRSHQLPLSGLFMLCLLPIPIPYTYMLLTTSIT